MSSEGSSAGDLSTLSTSDPLSPVSPPVGKKTSFTKKLEEARMLDQQQLCQKVIQELTGFSTLDPLSTVAADTKKLMEVLDIQGQIIDMEREHENCFQYNVSLAKGSIDQEKGMKLKVVAADYVQLQTVLSTVCTTNGENVFSSIVCDATNRSQDLAVLNMIHTCSGSQLVTEWFKQKALVTSSVLMQRRIKCCLGGIQQNQCALLRAEAKLQYEKLQEELKKCQESSIRTPPKTEECRSAPLLPSGALPPVQTPALSSDVGKTPVKPMTEPLKRPFSRQQESSPNEPQ